MRVRDPGRKEGSMLLRCLTRDPSIVSRTIVDECILVPIRHRTDDLAAIYTLNEVAARIWDLIDGRRRVIDIRDAIVAEFDVDTDRATADLLEILRQLEHVGALKES